MEAEGQIYGAGLPSTCTILFPWNGCLACGCYFRTVGLFADLVAKSSSLLLPSARFPCTGYGASDASFRNAFRYASREEKE